ncbi:MAG TPA: hypothetical protein VJ397_06955 [Thermoplasmata archaeon]|nr:hypothetical protein [Thermoplasmata archaeon]
MAGKAKLPYPIETLRHWYVSPFGGHSSEIEEGQVGLNREAVAANTDIDVLHDRVSVGVLGESRDVRPAFLRERFEVVPLDAMRPEALELSPAGEVVLPDAWNIVRRPRLHPRVGQAVVLEKPPGRLAADPEALAALIAEALRQRRDS